MAELYRRSAEAKAKLNADITTSMAFYAKYCTGGTLHIGGSKADATRAWCAPSQINTIETASGTRGFPEGSNATMDWTDVGVFQKEVRERIRPGTEIIKPRSTSRIMRWQRTGQDERIFYGIGKADNEKCINLSELSLAYEELINSMN